MAKGTRLYFCSLSVFCDSYEAMSTALPAAAIASWTLPRAKNCSLALNFYASVYTGAALSCPLSDIKKTDTQTGVCFFGTAKGTRLHFC